MSKISVDELQAIARDKVPLAGFFGIVVTAVSAGNVEMMIPYREDFVRPGGTVAGPVMMTLADFAVYGVVLSLIGPVELAVTTNLNINFLKRPAPSDLIAKARILKLGKRLAVAEVELNSGHDLVAHVTSTYSIPPT